MIYAAVELQENDIILARNLCQMTKEVILGPGRSSGESMELIACVGTAAALSTTIAFIPQILKIRRQGGQDLSYPMLFLYLTGILLWLVYGLLLHAAAVIWANAVTALLCGGRSHPQSDPPRRQARAVTKSLQAFVLAFLAPRPSIRR
jgi:MtN3 and saliva related transmembrane protein